MHTRRQLLVGVGGLAIASQLSASVTIAPTKARIEPVTTDYFGRQVSDPYRWMENAKDPEWTPWLKSQADYASAKLAALPERLRLAASVKRYAAEIETPGIVFPGGDNLFVQRRPKGAKTFQTFVRSLNGGADRLIIDPSAVTDVQGRSFITTEVVPSPDGRLLAANFVPNGDEDASTIRVFEVATARQIGEPLGGSRFGRISWLPDSTGFFFSRLAGKAPRGNVHFYDDPVSVLHLTDGSTPDRIVLQNRTFAGAPDNAQYIPYLIAQPGSEWVVAAFVLNIPFDGPLFIARLGDLLADKPAWRQVAAAEDNIKDVALIGDQLYLMSNRHASNYEVRLASAQKQSFQDAHIVVPESHAVLERLSPSSEGVWVRGMKGGLGHLQFVALDGRVQAVDLPDNGSLWGVMTQTKRPEAFLGFDDYTTFGGFYQVDNFGSAPRQITAVAPFPFPLGAYHVERTTVRSRDGVMVPVDLVKRRNLERDGRNPVLIQAYGAYGKSIEPIFQPQFLAFLDEGGIYVIAHVRGGGERGEAWHVAGQKATKPNTWRDAIDVGEWLISSRWSGHGRLALWGTSAGGIMVGRAITERPDLFAAAIDRVGVSDLLRMELTQNGPSNIGEFGTVTKEEEFGWLLAMSPYHSVVDGERYPAVLLMTGANDPRVEPWQLGKLTARLQAASASSKPIMLRVEYAGGHGGGATIESQNNELVDMFAFVLEHTRQPRK